MLGGALIEAAEVGKGRNLFSVFLIAADGAVGEAESKGGVRITARSFDRETRPGDLRVSLLLRLVIGINSLTRRPRDWVNQKRKVKQGIVRRLDGSAVAGVEFLTKCKILQLRPRDEFRGAAAVVPAEYYRSRDALSSVTDAN